MGPGRLLALVLLVAAALRAPGLFTDLWLDEIWSVTAVESLRSPLDVFTGFKSDNNHHLNSLWIYVVGPGASAASYRLAAFAAGLASVFFAWMIGARGGRLAALVSAGLVATCFPLVAYSSEARGYALVVACALGAWYFLQRYVDRPGLRRVWPFWACAVAGFLSHLSMVHVIAGSAVYVIVAGLRRGATAGSIGRCLAEVFVVPVAGVLAFAYGALRGTRLGGGPPYSMPHLLAEVLSSGAGGPASGPAMWLVAALLLLAFVAALVRQMRQRDGGWVFYAVAVLVSPAALLIAGRPPFLFVRYFAVQIALLLVAVGGLLAAGLQSSRGLRVASGALLATFLTANGVALGHFITQGRGHYAEALRHMCAEAGGRPITVASDHDFRNRMTFGFHARGLAQGCQAVYMSRTELPHDGADWMILHSLDPDEHPPATVDLRGLRYVFDGTYPAHRSSGLTWHLYRRAPLVP